MLKIIKKCCSFYINEELQIKLKNDAKRSKRSVSSYICLLIENAPEKI